MAKRGYRTIKVELADGNKVSVYASPRVADALETITADATLYEGVQLMKVLEAVYNQGHKDGAREAFEDIDRRFEQSRATIKHLNPGRPKKKR